jgi:sulfur relay (sulfurtransferase) DsrC/TusE family protein
MEKLLGRTYDDTADEWPDRPWTIHDLRRTFYTLNVERAPSSEPAVKAVVNHSEGGVGKKYNQSEYLKAKYDLLEAWEADVKRMIAGLPRPVQEGKEKLPFM